MQVQPHSPPELLTAYAARPDRYDELCQRIGSVVVVRPHWREFQRALEARPVGELAAPYVVVCLALALAERRPRELVGWLLGALWFMAVRRVVRRT